MNYELLLINAVRDYNGHSECFKDSIGQYLIAAYLREKNFKAYVYSGCIADCKKVIEDEIENSHVPVVGFYAAADNIRVTEHMIKWMKTKYPEIITVIGGPQVIDLNYSFFERTRNDFAIIGEGEIPMHYLLEYLIDNEGSIDSIPSLVYSSKEDNKLVVNQCDNAIIQNLDSIPYPSIDDSLKRNLRQGECVGIITGRGCPYQCSFCYEGANAKNVRFRSIENVMQEIDYIKSINSKMKYLNIYDDTFTLKKDRVLEFCKNIKEKNIKWFCEGHVSFVNNNKEILKEMVNSGLMCIQFGIESGSDVVLQGYNKGTTYESILQAIKICKNSGVHGITGNFIVGGAYETKETIAKSMDLAEKLIFSAKGIIELYTVYFAPYPNTKIVNRPENYDIKIIDDLQNMNLNTMRSPVVETKYLSTEDIYNQKHNFDEFLDKTYKYAALTSTKEDVLQGLFADGQRIHLNPTWEKYYLSIPHIVNFIDHLSDEEQFFDDNKYIIRTFEDFIIKNNIMVTEIGSFFGIEKEVLLNATGIYTVKQMAELFQVSIDTIKEIYVKYNDKCMLYMSEF